MTRPSPSRRGWADGQTALVASQYDTFQTGLERIGKAEKYLNYGYARRSGETYEERQAELCRRVFALAEIGPGDTVVDVGFGSGEQDLLLAREHAFDQLYGFNVATRQVAYARERARAAGLSGRLHFHHGPAEDMSILAARTIDKMIAVECAFYFERERFYAEAARVLRPGGRLALADISFDDRVAFLVERVESLQRVGTFSSNRAAWERHLCTVRVENINGHARPGAQQTVWRCVSSITHRLRLAELRTWLSMGLNTQAVVIGLATGLLRYDLILLDVPLDGARAPETTHGS